MKTILGLMLIIWGAAGAALPVGAQQAADSDLVRAAFPKKTQGCFRRVYDSAHLARNPNQTVAEIRLSRGPSQLKDEAIEGPEAPELALKLGLTMKGAASGRVQEGVACHGMASDAGDHGRAFLECSLICGRGHFDIIPQSADRLAVKIGGTVQGRAIAEPAGVGIRCDSDAGVVWLGEAEGDRTLILDRVPLSECAR